MPVRFEPCGQIYRRFEYGSPASISMLHLRTYRSQQTSGVVDPPICASRPCWTDFVFTNRGYDGTVLTEAFPD